MTSSDWNNDNRREFIRVKMQIEFCVSPLGAFDSGTENEDCCSFITKTIDISLGGICIAHNGKLAAGDAVELRTKNSLTSMKCLNCTSVLFMDSTYELQPIEADVVWSNDQYAGIKFRKLSIRNENILSKAIWDSHIQNVRSGTHKN